MYKKILLSFFILFAGLTYGNSCYNNIKKTKNFFNNRNISTKELDLFLSKIKEDNKDYIELKISKQKPGILMDHTNICYSLETTAKEISYEIKTIILQSNIENPENIFSIKIKKGSKILELGSSLNLSNIKQFSSQGLDAYAIDKNILTNKHRKTINADISKESSSIEIQKITNKTDYIVSSNMLCCIRDNGQKTIELKKEDIKKP